jgi:hypothetical protein
MPIRRWCVAATYAAIATTEAAFHRRRQDPRRDRAALLLPGYPAIERFPYGREGGLMMLVSRIVETDPARNLDAVIYLMDPVDPSNFPRRWLQRQCVITASLSCRRWRARASG